MATNPTIDRNAILAARRDLQPVPDSRWLGGFRDLFGKEMSEWFGTRRWLWQSLIWLSIINGFIAFLLFIVPSIDPTEVEGVPPPDVMGLTLFYSFGVMAGTIGMIILAQDEIIGEKQTGTAAWILSKPVSRPAFILSKVLSGFTGGLLFIVALPAAVTLIEVYLATRQIPPILTFLAGAGIVLLALTFYLTLVILLGVLFDQRGPVLGIAFGVMFGGLILTQFVPQLGFILPVGIDKIALAVSQGQALPPQAVFQVIATAVWSVIFLILALIRFERQEF